MKNSHFIYFAVLTLMLVSCEPPPETKPGTSRVQPGSKLAHPQDARGRREGARAALKANGKSITTSDWNVIEDFDDFTARWNRAAAPFVRDYLDPNVPADRW